jgi:hypothetical protein
MRKNFWALLAGPNALPPKRLGFAKRLGQIYLTEYHPLNPRMPLFGPGAKMKGYVCAQGNQVRNRQLKDAKPIQIGIMVRVAVPSPPGGIDE